MNVNSNFMKLYNQIKYLSINNIKSFNQNERITIKLAIENINNSFNDNSFIASSINSKLENDIQKLTNKLCVLNRLRVLNQSSPSKSNFLQRIWKGIQNFFGWRLSSIAVIYQKNQIDQKVEQCRNELRDLPGKIEQKKTSLREWKEMTRFFKEDALPAYQDILDFYKNLPVAGRNDQSIKNTKASISTKLKEIKAKVDKAKTDEKDPSYIKILEKEILASLNNMSNYGGNNLKGEIEQTIRAFSNAVGLASNISVANEQMQKLANEIAALETKKKNLENTFF